MNTSPSLRGGTSLLNSRSCLLLVPLLTFFAIVFVVLAHGGDKKASKEQSKATTGQTKYVRPTDPALYVGADTCKTCHEEISATFEKTPHFATTMDAKLDAHKGEESHGSEAYHGPGKDHVHGAGDTAKIFTSNHGSPPQISAPTRD